MERINLILCGGAVMGSGLLLSVTASCGHGGAKENTGGDSAAATEVFHADNDIAMTVRSVADAISVGEPLDTANYNFNGVLTDGQGRPIYTNLHGVPGKWCVDAVSDTSLTIRNVDLGDLLSDDLESYITSSLGVDAGNLVDSLSGSVPDGHATHVYDFGGGKIRFEVHNVSTPNDQTAAMMIISLNK